LSPPSPCRRAQELEDRAEVVVRELAELEPEHGAGERPDPGHAAGADRLDERTASAGGRTGSSSSSSK